MFGRFRFLIPQGIADAAAVGAALKGGHLFPADSLTSVDLPNMVVTIDVPDCPKDQQVKMPIGWAFLSFEYIVDRKTKLPLDPVEANKAIDATTLPTADIK